MPKSTYVLTNDGDSKACYVYAYNGTNGRTLKVWIPRVDVRMRPQQVRVTLEIVPTPALSRTGRVKKGSL
jgi:hypothetical protein